MAIPRVAIKAKQLKYNVKRELIFTVLSAYLFMIASRYPSGKLSWLLAVDCKTLAKPYGAGSHNFALSGNRNPG